MVYTQPGHFFYWTISSAISNRIKVSLLKLRIFSQEKVLLLFVFYSDEQTQCDSLDAKKYSEWKASQTALVTAWHGQTILNLKNIELKPAGNAKYYLSLEWMFVKPGIFIIYNCQLQGCDKW